MDHSTMPPSYGGYSPSASVVVIWDRNLGTDWTHARRQSYHSDIVTRGGVPPGWGNCLVRVVQMLSLSLID